MNVRLTGYVGTGKKIMENLQLFDYKFNGIEDENLYKFKISFGEKSGYFNIRVDENGSILEESTMDIGFKRPLGVYKDFSLITLAKMMLEDTLTN